MKALSGVIVIGLVIVAGAIAFLWGASETAGEETFNELGLSGVNAFPRPDELAIEITWTATDGESTYILQRTQDTDDDSWTGIATIAPDSNVYDTSMRAVYVDADVEHLVTYYYRLRTIDTHDPAVSQAFGVTAVKPSR